MKVIEKSWNEFWAYYWRVDDLHRIPGIAEWDQKLVTFIEHVCQLKPPARILDLACGGGDQAKVFAQRGYTVVGVDIAPSLIEYAQRQFAEANLEGTFMVGDMRAIDYDAEFDVCVILSGSFGFFGDREDQELLCSIQKALKVGGQVFIMCKSVHRREKHARSWREIDDGWELSEGGFDTETSTSWGTTFIIRRDGTMIVEKKEPGIEASEGTRFYTVPEMQKMFAQAGLEYIACYSDRHLDVPAQPLGRNVIREIIVGRRSPG